jgi:hypothetical protein
MFLSRVWAALKARPLSEIVGYGVILVRNALGLPNRMPTLDRETLEQVIMPAYAARSDIKTVLFVGCAWYTRHYEKMLPGRVYWTIDPDPWKKRFGARRHIIAGLESLDAHIAPASLDLIICNGVFGWGLDDRAACERAFEGCFNALRPRGRTYHRVERRSRTPAAGVGQPAIPGALSSVDIRAPGLHPVPGQPGKRHVFNFYAKP